MSYTQFVSTARCSVAEDFDLKEYLTTLSDFIANHIEDLSDGISWVFEDMTQDETIHELELYCRISDGQLLIELDTEEKNGNSDVHEWLYDQIRQDVMTSKFMEISCATIDSRSGVECGTSYYGKDGTFIGSDDIQGIVEQYVKMSN